MNHTGEGLRYRLVANGGYDCPKREVGVQYRVGAKVARSKLLSPCKDCCCFSHCQINIHVKDFESYAQMDDFQEFSFPNMLDRSWAVFAEYQEEMVEKYARENEDLMDMLCAVNTDFDADEEADPVKET